MEASGRFLGGAESCGGNWYQLKCVCLEAVYDGVLESGGEVVFESVM